MVYSLMMGEIICLWITLSIFIFFNKDFSFRYPDGVASSTILNLLFVGYR